MILLPPSSGRRRLYAAGIVWVTWWQRFRVADVRLLRDDNAAFVRHVGRVAVAQVLA
jgi:hypothetical protein